MRKMSEKHEMMYKALGEMVSKKRQEANLSQQALALKLGRKHSYIEQIELGARRFNVVEFMDMCDAMDCSSHDVMVEWLQLVKAKEDGLSIL